MSTQCWYCQKTAMEAAPELGSGWTKCSERGATDNPPMATGQPLQMAKGTSYYYPKIK